MIRKVRRMLTMEQFRSHRIGLLTTKYNIDIVQNIYRELFRLMIENGTMRAGNPEMLAMEFAAPISLLIQLYAREPEREREIMERIEEFLRYFADEHKM